MQQFPFPQGDGFGGIASHEVSCRRFVFVLGHDGDRYAEYGRLVGGGSLFEDGPRVTSASTRSTASPSSCLVPSLPFPSLPCLPHRAEGSGCNEFPSLQSAALVGFTRSAGRNDGWLSHSCSFRARASLSMADNGCLLAAFAFAQNQVKLRVRFSLNNLKLDDDVLNIPLFQADQADRLISQALRIRGQAGIESK